VKYCAENVKLTIEEWSVQYIMTVLCLLYIVNYSRYLVGRLLLTAEGAICKLFGSSCDVMFIAQLQLVSVLEKLKLTLEE